ncbi:hypothetical protein DSO57_1011647 [Entomophthora muscae]|uniref:Uncharacterized protein n=1 Tax=Entomophthora muscae TaxID=34485 RepID=A0ACC2RL05_9FUNG|nr:hypothetical protein DSO57_1011647 [Entomophthora muscae]
MSLFRSATLFRRSGLARLSAFQHSWKYSTKKYTQDHEWIEVNGNVATLGLTKYATKHLGEIVFAEIPDVGSKFGKGDSVAAVESVKAVGEVYSPVSGDVVERNDALADDFSLLNDNPRSEGSFLLNLFDH